MINSMSLGRLAIIRNLLIVQSSKKVFTAHQITKKKLAIGATKQNMHYN